LRGVIKLVLLGMIPYRIYRELKLDPATSEGPAVWHGSSVRRLDLKGTSARYSMFGEMGDMVKAVIVAVVEVVK